MFDRTIILSQRPAGGIVTRLLTTPTRDSIDELLTGLTVNSTVYCLSELRAPWGFRVEGRQVAKFHLVLDGHAWLCLDGPDPVELGEGDLVILPRGEGHSVSDGVDSPIQRLDRILAHHPLEDGARLYYGGQGAQTRLLCGGLVLGGAVQPALLALLPTVVQIDAARSQAAAWLQPTFAMLRQEAEHRTPGAQAILAKLADVFLAQALRQFLVGAQQAGLLNTVAPHDNPIAQAVELIRGAPARRWTLAELAREVGTSRTAFATRFRAATGNSPMRYVATIRLGLAAGFLTTTKLSVEAIAPRVGYDSDAALSKAFKREYGVSPNAYRHGRNALTATELAR
jgi:AraC-like DNA-binding protein/mannose-6-phosphate isomerase-like protein (cupin superfamily)